MVKKKEEETINFNELKKLKSGIISKINTAKEVQKNAKKRSPAISILSGFQNEILEMTRAGLGPTAQMRVLADYKLYFSYKTFKKFLDEHIKPIVAIEEDKQIIDDLEKKPKKHLKS